MGFNLVARAEVLSPVPLASIDPADHHRFEFGLAYAEVMEARRRSEMAEEELQRVLHQLDEKNAQELSLRRELSHAYLLNRCDARVIEKLRMEVEFLQRSQADVNSEIETLISENEDLEKQPGGKDTEAFKNRSKQVAVLLALKDHFETHRQMYASGPGSSSQQPVLPSPSFRQSTPPAPPSRRRKEPA